MKKIYVGCPNCGRRYLAIQRGCGLYIRKHNTFVPYISWIGISNYKIKMVCSGSHKQIFNARDNV